MKTRTPGAAVIERRLLDLAHTTDAKITAPTLAYFAPCSIDEAAAVLDDLAGRERMGMEIEDDGTIVYQLYGRQRLSPVTALVPIAPARHAASPLAAAALTALMPGAGHLYAGQVVAAIVWFLVVGAGYALILPGLVLHLICMASAAAAARRPDTRARLQLAPARAS